MTATADQFSTTPIAWTGAHVATRLTEAFETLLAIPGGGGGRPSSGYWPRYDYDWEDLLAQQEQAIEEKRQQQHAQNRVRLSPPVAAISAMETALAWPAAHLRGTPVLMRATNAVAFAFAIDRDCRFVAKRYGGKPQAWRDWHWQGCQLIAWRLVKSNAAVF